MAYVESPRFEKRKLSKDEMKIISREDWSKLRMAVPEASAFYIPMMIAYYTGMRRGEVSALEWKNVDMEDKIIHVCLWQDKPTYNCSAKVHNSASSLGQKKKPLRAS